MNTGTKIFLAVFALFVGVLVLYYGVMTPPEHSGVPQLAVHDPAVDSQPASGANERLTMLSASPATAGDSLAAHPIGDELASAAADGTSGTQLHIGLDPTRMLPLANVSSASLPSDLSPETDGSSSDEPALVFDAPPVVAPQPQPQPEAVKPKAPPITTIVERPAGTVRTNTGVTITPSSSSAGRKPAPPQTTEYVVKSGDTMVTIARDWFGDEGKWSLIAKANPWVDPARMQIGQKLQLPAKDAKPSAVKDQVAANTSVYIVRSGDSLAKIAREFYGNVAMWERIYQANRSVIGNDPAALQVGMKLVMPKAN